MTWNYRVMRIVTADEVSHGVHEVYYDEQGRPKMYSSEPCPIYGETLEDLTSEIRRFEAALKLPVLTPEDFVSI